MNRAPRRRRRGPLVIVVLVLIAAALIAGVIFASRDSNEESTSAAPAVCQVAKVAGEVQPSVVTISANGATGAGTGSGEVIRSDGHILTNNHVISQAADGGHVEVLFSDGTSVDATITGRDPRTDLAVLDVHPPFDLPVIDIGTSADLQVGQPVVALGAPLGLSGTVTSGIVSALDRNIHVPGDNGGQALLVSAVQTDASINPGNSGGALVNCSGQLVGVPTAGAVIPGSGGGGSIGLGFAIPVDAAIKIADEIIDTGSVTHAFFGMGTAPIPQSAAEQAGTSGGLYVSAVQPGGPAAQAGIAPGDIITEIEGAPAVNNTQLETLTLTQKPGDIVTLTYERDGHTANADVTLGAAPDTTAGG
jgi:putative serine protease PepD